MADLLPAASMQVTRLAPLRRLDSKGQSIATILRNSVIAAARRPLLTVFAVALVGRLAVVAGIALLVDGYLIPDEAQYVVIADLASRGMLTEDVWSGHGQFLYWTTAAFSVPLTGLFWLFGPHPLLGQMLAAMVGAVVAVLATRLALEAVEAKWAVLAGLGVALLPSQVLWSSVVLRESMVWLGLALVALAVTVAANRSDARRLGGLAGLAGIGLVILGFLRPQTFVVAAWAVPLATLLMRPLRPVLVRGGAVALALLVPLGVGEGPGGLYIVERAVPSLATIRTSLALDADSSFRRPLTTVPAPVAPTGPGSPVGTGEPTDEQVRRFLLQVGLSVGEVEELLASLAVSPEEDPQGAIGRAVRALNERPDAERRLALARGLTGDLHVVEDTAQSHLRAFGPGLVATVLRPAPWENSTSSAMAFARLEGPLWYLLYGLAAVGIWLRRRDWNLWAYPVVCTAAVLAVAALSQGNLGTAFRHRGQVLWAIALLAAMGLSALAARATDKELERVPVDAGPER